MPADDEYSPTDEAFSPSAELDITVNEEGSDESEQIGEGDIISHELDHKQLFGNESNDLDVLDLEGNDLENGDEQVLDLETTDLEFSKEIENGDESGSAASADLENGICNGNDPPLVGMEFDSYDEAYNYYNNYGKDLGFAIRVKSSWTKRNSKEKRGAVLCCNCEGFKMMKEASSRRKETRTGCLAMLRLRLVDSNKWRVDEVKLEHNHLFDPERAQQSKSQKKMDVTGFKRRLESPPDVEVRTIKLYRTHNHTHSVSVDTSCEREIGDNSDLSSKCLKLQTGDAQVMNDFFRRKQLTNPNFFYSMDLNDDGHLRNVFWIDSRSRAAYSHFGDVLAFDTSCLSNRYMVPVFAFLGINHHGESIILGCGLLADETSESYVWLLRTWLTCMLGRPPQTILTDQCNALRSAIAEVFPRAQHRVCPSLVMKKILGSLSQLENYELFQQTLSETVYNSNKVDVFEMGWEDMIRRFGLTDLDWLQSLYEERELWAPVYSKDTFLAGTFVSCKLLKPAFKGYVHEQTQLKELFDSYELIFQQQIRKESTDDAESRESNPTLKTRCAYELQLSKVYTKAIFSKFQAEVEMVSSCLSVTQSHANGPVITYTVKERNNNNDDITSHRSFRNSEVMFDKSMIEVRCNCKCFGLEGYLCRHALCVLSYHGINEIPAHHILARWRMDFKRLYVPDVGPDSIDASNAVLWFDHLHRRAMQVVGEGTTSQDHYMVAWHAFKESLNKLRLVAEKRI